jgi:serine/threonine protein kinase
MARILIADDDKLVHKIYQKIIEPLGHELWIVENGEEAVRLLEEREYDLIILDNMMPVMDGYEACQRIRLMQNGITAPVIIVSADDSQESILKFLHAGANDYLIKPINETLIIAKLRNFLDIISLHKNELTILKNHEILGGKYKTEKILGYGKHSIVFLAENVEDSTKAAVKFYNHNLITEEIAEKIKGIAQNIREADLENVVDIYDIDTYGEYLYIVMEYAEDGTLAGELQSKSSMNEQEVVKVGVDIANALISLNKAEIPHLNIKPENILKFGDSYKLSDFGIVSTAAEGGDELDNQIWVTPAFSAPELLKENNHIAEKSDVYSLGIVLYSALIGDNPFMADKPATSISRQLNIIPTSLLEFQGSFSIETSLLLDMMLSKSYIHRPKPEEIKKTLSYVYDALQGKTSKKLTYVAKKPALSKEISEKEIKANSKKVHAAVSEVAKATDVEIATTSWDRSIIRRGGIGKKNVKDNNLFFLFAMIAATLGAVFLVHLGIQSLFFSGTDIDDTIPQSVFLVKCSQCGLEEEKAVLDIEDCRCSECGGRENFVWKCNKCKKGSHGFTIDESVLDKDLPDEELIEVFDNLYKCPFCHSDDIMQIEESKSAVK